MGPARVGYDDGDPSQSSRFDCPDLAVAGESIVISGAARHLDICATGGGGQRVNIKLASDIVGSLMLIAGVAIA